jgi:hypothetical protein
MNGHLNEARTLISALTQSYPNISGGAENCESKEKKWGTTLKIGHPTTKKISDASQSAELLVQQRSDEGDEFIDDSLLMASVFHFPLDRIEQFCFFINIQLMLY